eukprot:TRINITY_DN1346_c0_g1_i2.p1 TRINITY_DN1346_c0_g1~~TRINITY_DN1346_c0_g1_i2.p1  ORF type:complete len:232 (-),score=47.10 TRINITY_DN1346_c0_g1_i2:59-754(-)
MSAASAIDRVTHSFPMHIYNPNMQQTGVSVTASAVPAPAPAPMHPPPFAPFADAPPAPAPPAQVSTVLTPSDLHGNDLSGSQGTQPQQPQPQQQPHHPPQRAGDWNCPDCGNLNFSYRDVCRRCNRARGAPPPLVAASSPDHTGQSAAPSQIGQPTGQQGAQQQGEQNQQEQEQVTPADTMCVVCFERAREVVLAPCGHMGLCQPCSELLHECPVCRAPYSPDQAIKVFKP